MTLVLQIFGILFAAYALLLLTSITASAAMFASALRSIAVTYSVGTAQYRQDQLEQLITGVDENLD